MLAPDHAARVHSNDYTRLVVGFVAEALTRSRAAGEAQAVIRPSQLVLDIFLPGGFVTVVPKQPEGYLPVIGSNYLAPITAQLEKIAELQPRDPNEVQASPLENGYSVALVVLSALMLESFIARTQYVIGQSPPSAPIDFVRSEFPESGFSDKIEEIYVLRDAIAHNHLWETKFKWDEKLGMKLVSANPASGYGDKKFRKVLDPSRRITRHMRLNLFPTRINRSDAFKVLKVVVAFLRYLESINRDFVYISPQPVKYLGQMQMFVEIVEALEVREDEA